MVEVFQIDKPTFKFWRKNIIFALKLIPFTILLLYLSFIASHIVFNIWEFIGLQVFFFFVTLIKAREPYLYKIILEDNYFTMFYYIYRIPFRTRIKYTRCIATEHTHTTDYIIIQRRYTLRLSYVDIDINKGWSKEQLDEIIGILKEHGVKFTRVSIPLIANKRNLKK